MTRINAYDHADFSRMHLAELLARPLPDNPKYVAELLLRRRKWGAVLGHTATDADWHALVRLVRSRDTDREL